MSLDPREAFSDLFEVNKSAHEMSNSEAYNKLRSLYRGGKKDSVIKLISKTFVALCEYADFDSSPLISSDVEEADSPQAEEPQDIVTSTSKKALKNSNRKKIELNTLQYHINIVLPDTRDQAVYDAIFKSLRDHLG